uniref:Wsv222-like protein n=1 Tax=Trachysalambria curvirostris nimavirus TaxID=2984282 RepID=A0A9C7C056_9VIRU|nr:MAG: wsv222-like protein [Trachysalambria curvirostris nimavirus]
MSRRPARRRLFRASENSTEAAAVKAVVALLQGSCEMSPCETSQDSIVKRLSKVMKDHKRILYAFHEGQMIWPFILYRASPRVIRYIFRKKMSYIPPPEITGSNGNSILMSPLDISVMSTIIKVDTEYFCRSLALINQLTGDNLLHYHCKSTDDRRSAFVLLWLGELFKRLPLEDLIPDIRVIPDVNGLNFEMKTPLQIAIEEDNRWVAAVVVTVFGAYWFDDCTVTSVDAQGQTTSVKMTYMQLAQSCNSFSCLDLFDQLRQTYMIGPNVGESNITDTVCGICQGAEKDDRTYRALICTHTFHCICLMRMFASSESLRCPLCRQRLDNLKKHSPNTIYRLRTWSQAEDGERDRISDRMQRDGSYLSEQVDQAIYSLMRTPNLLEGTSHTGDAATALNAPILANLLPRHSADRVSDADPNRTTPLSTRPALLGSVPPGARDRRHRVAPSSPTEIPVQSTSHNWPANQIDISSLSERLLPYRSSSHQRPIPFDSGNLENLINIIRERRCTYLFDGLSCPPNFHQSILAAANAVAAMSLSASESEIVMRDIKLRLSNVSFENVTYRVTFGDVQSIVQTRSLAIYHTDQRQLANHFSIASSELNNLRDMDISTINSLGIDLSPLEIFSGSSLERLIHILCQFVISDVTRIFLPWEFGNVIGPAIIDVIAEYLSKKQSYITNHQRDQSVIDLMNWSRDLLASKLQGNSLRWMRFFILRESCQYDSVKLAWWMNLSTQQRNLRSAVYIWVLEFSDKCSRLFGVEREATETLLSLIISTCSVLL